MDATSQTLPQIPARMGRTSQGAQPARRGYRGSPRGPAPPIEQRFTGPIGVYRGPDRGNPFGSLPGIAKRQGQRSKAAWSWVTSPVNIVLTAVLVAASVAMYATHIIGPGTIFKINLVWPV